MHALLAHLSIERALFHGVHLLGLPGLVEPKPLHTDRQTDKTDTHTHKGEQCPIISSTYIYMVAVYVNANNAQKKESA